MENIAIIMKIICFVAELIADIRTHRTDKSIKVFLLAQLLMYKYLAQKCLCVLLRGVIKIATLAKQRPRVRPLNQVTQGIKINQKMVPYLPGNGQLIVPGIA
jgi:hypothetical protein